MRLPILSKMNFQIIGTSVEASFDLGERLRQSFSIRHTTP